MERIGRQGFVVKVHKKLQNWTEGSTIMEKIPSFAVVDG